MFNFLKGDKTEFSLTWDRADGIYYPGDTATVTIHLRPEKDLKVQSGHLLLTGDYMYQYCTQEYRTDSDGDSHYENVYYWAANNLFEFKQDFLSEGTLPGGMEQRYTYSVTLPDNPLPSCEGKIIRVVWRAIASVARRMAKDLHTELILQMHMPAPGQAVTPGEYGGSNEPAEADMSLLLPGLEFVIGETIQGELRILPQKDFDASEVRLELQRREVVPDDQGNKAEKTITQKLAGKTHFSAGQAQIFTFQAPIPPDEQPSIYRDDQSLSWTLALILARTLRKDTRLEQEFYVYKHGIN